MRVVDVFVDELDLKLLGFDGVDPSATPIVEAQNTTERALASATETPMSRSSVAQQLARVQEVCESAELIQTAYANALQESAQQRGRSRVPATRRLREFRGQHRPVESALQRRHRRIPR